MASKFIPQYQAETPEEQGKLEEKFLRFVNHVSLEDAVLFASSPQCKVQVSQEGDTVYIRPENFWQMIKEGSIAVSSTGQDGKKAEVIMRYITERKYDSGSLRTTQNLEIAIDGEKYILPRFTCTLA